MRSHGAKIPNIREAKDNVILATVSRLIVVMGAATICGSLALLPYAGGQYVVDEGNGRFTIAHGARSLWEMTTREPLVLTLVAVLVAGFAMAGLIATRHWRLSLCSTFLSFWLLGQIFFAGYPTYRHFAVGFWIDVAAALVILGSSLISAFMLPIDKTPILAENHGEAT